MRDVHKQGRQLERDYVCQQVWVSCVSLVPSSLCSCDQDNLVGGGGCFLGLQTTLTGPVNYVRCKRIAFLSSLTFTTPFALPKTPQMIFFIS